MSVRSLGSLFCGGLIGMGLLFGASPCSAATPREIDTAIDNGVKFLYAQQNEQGNWDHILKPNAAGKWIGDTKQEGGPTALALYALLSAGEDPKDPRLVKSIDYLRKVTTSGIYAVGLRANVMAQLPLTPEVRQVIYRDGELLRNAIRGGKDVKLRGFYGYGANTKSGNDRSTSQFAVLGAWAFASAGNELGEDYWRAVDTAWRKNQMPDGAWNYASDRPASVSMTAAGVATLFITTEYLHAIDTGTCHGNYVDDNLANGMKWLGDNFPNVFASEQPFYALYGIERCAEAGGVKYFGTSNWFDLGADWIVKQQASNGSVRGNSIPDTAFAVLFLARGRAPVAVSKLGYPLETVDQSKPADAATLANWNQRPRDVANLSRWVGKQQERTLNWQVVTLSAPAEELQDAPILYIAGNQPLKFTDEEAGKLRQFVEDGGLIVGNADCSNAKFGEAYKKLGSQLFPTYEFRVLPTDHVIYTNEQFPASAWKNKPSVLGLSNGSRELMLLIPTGDLAKYWQMHLIKGHEETHELMADIFAYAIGLSKKLHKGESHIVKTIADIQPERTMKLARLQYPGNWNPEPGGWRRLAALLHNEQKIDMAIEAVELGTGKLDNTYAVASLTGTVAFKMSPAMKAELKKFVEEGGTLLVDACGSASAFASDIEADLSSIFTAGKPQMAVLPLAHPLYAKGFPSEPKITEVEYRLYARKTLTGELKAPRIRGANVAGRTAVYFSPEDLSTALVGHAVDGVPGYTPKSATDITMHLLLTAAPKLPPKPDDPNAPKPEEPKPEEPKPDAPKPEEPKPDAPKPQ